MHTPDNFPNPYESSATGSLPTARGMPTYCHVMFIIDLIMCVFRLGMAFIGLLAFVAAAKQGSNPLIESPLFKVALIAEFGIGLFGIAGNGVMLARQRWGAILGYLTLLCTAVAILMALLQGISMLQQFPEGSPERLGGYIGLGVTLLIRVGLLGMVTVAVFKFADWAKAAEQPAQV